MLARKVGFQVLARPAVHDATVGYPFSRSADAPSPYPQEDGRLGFAFDGGVAYGILLTIRQVDNPRVLGTTNREIRPVGGRRVRRA